MNRACVMNRAKAREGGVECVQDTGRFRQLYALR
jgi:hypothetical protein